MGKASFPQTGVLLRQARHRYCKQSSKGLSRDDPGQAEGKGLPQCQGMQVTLVRSPLHSCNLLSRTIPQKGSRSHHFAVHYTLAKQEMPRAPP